MLQRQNFDKRIYNVVTTNATVRDLVDVISEHVPNLAVEFVDSPIMNQLSYNVASRRVAGLGFTCQGSLEQGIAETIALLKGARQS
jgi:nucleoside-diphosphate-sugar epimerase